jgi:hypothetical protein
MHSEGSGRNEKDNLLKSRPLVVAKAIMEYLVFRDNGKNIENIEAKKPYA